MKKLFWGLLLVFLIIFGCVEQLYINVDIFGEKKEEVDFTILYHGYIVQAGTGIMQVGSNWRSFKTAEEWQNYLEYNEALAEIELSDTVDFATETVYYYGYPRGMDASRDWSHKIKAVYLEPRFEIVWDDTVAPGKKNQEDSVGYQIWTSDGTNVCVREVWLLKAPKPND